MCRHRVWTDLRQWGVALLQIAVLRHGVRALLCLETEQGSVCFGSPFDIHMKHIRYVLREA